MLTWRPAAVLAGGALLLILVPSGWFAIGLIAAVALVCALDILVAGAPGDVRMTRDGDRLVRLGGTAHVTLRLTNTGLRAVHADVRDAWVPSAGIDAPVTRVHIDPSQTAHVVTELCPTRRGDRPAVRVTIRSYGPFGFGYRQSTARRARRDTPPWVLRVTPRFDSRRFLPEKIARLRVFDGAVTTRGRGQGTEFDALREYVQGDDVRSIDWRATARRNDVVVRTWRPERDRHVLCVVDTGRTSAVRVGTTSVEPGDVGLDEPRLDAAIDAALLLGEVAHRAGDSVSLIAADTAIRASVAGVGNRGLMATMVAALAPLEPVLVESDFRRIASEVLRRERKRALVVLFTALDSGALGEGLLPVLTQLTARHMVMVAAVTDPAIEEYLHGRGTADAVYLAASALRARTDRQRVADALRKRGVTVIDAPVGRYASDVVDAYLAMKAAGQL